MLGENKGKAAHLHRDQAWQMLFEKWEAIMDIGVRDIAWSVSPEMLFYTSSTAHFRSMHEEVFFQNNVHSAIMVYFILVVFGISFWFTCMSILFWLSQETPSETRIRVKLAKKWWGNIENGSRWKIYHSKLLKLNITERLWEVIKTHALNPKRAIWLTGSSCSGQVSGLCLWGGRAEFRTLVHQRPSGPT